ncbi:MAG: glycosyltransferase family 2 protein [Fimbriimonadales bacterium]
MPTVSVITTAYNAAPYIAQAIESVQAQTLTDWELIIVDDASTDQTVAVAEPYLSDTRIHLIQHTENRGPSAGRNRALDAAQGEWVAILDADDWFEPNRLERLIHAAHQLQVSIVYDLNRQVDANTGEVLRVFFASAAPPPNAPTRYTPAEAIRLHLTLKPLIHRETLEQARLRYREDITLGEDYLFQTLFTIETGGCGVLPEPLYNYRVHRGSTYHRHFFDLSQPQRVYETLLAHPKVRQDKRLLGAVRSDYRRVMLARAYPQFTQAIKRREWRKAREIYRTAPFVLPHLLWSLPNAVLRRLRRENTAYDWEAFR